MNRSEAWAPNTIQPHATKAVIMRIHSHTNFKPDLILAFRALMVEAQEYGYHVFFLTTVCSSACLNLVSNSASSGLVPTQLPGLGTSCCETSRHSRITHGARATTRLVKQLTMCLACRHSLGTSMKRSLEPSCCRTYPQSFGRTQCCTTQQMSAHTTPPTAYRSSTQATCLRPG